MKHLAFFGVIITLFSCNTNSTSVTDTDKTEQSFEFYKEEFVGHLWELYPDWSTHVGFGQYDHLLSIPDEEFREKERQFVASNLNYLNKINVEELSPSNQTDYYLIKNHLEKTQWQADTFRSFEWNPASYNVAGGFSKILGNKKTSPLEKFEKAGKRLKFVPAYYEQAAKNIKDPTLEHSMLAIQQSEGTKSYLDKTLREEAKKTIADPSELAEFEKSLDSAVLAVGAYIRFLNESILPGLKKNGARPYSIGKEHFEQKFKYEIQSVYSAEEIYNKAVDVKKGLHEKIAEISKTLWGKYFPDKVQPEDKLQMSRILIEKIAENHVPRDSFISAIEKQIPELEQFIREREIIYMDPSKPLVVRKTPEYMAGVAGASISAPGPYDKEGETYYNVTPLTAYSETEAKSYLREYNHYVLQILNIHEAIPGHYMQLVYSNQSPSLVKSILGNGSMIEGWAVYTERMMLEEGYRNHEPEMWLMYYKWHLRTVCNTILDYSVHVLGMDENQGLDLLVREAFQEETEARGKWKRATLSQVQLCSYFTGFTEIYHLRDELKKSDPEGFNLKSFHEKFLSYGSAPVKYIHKLMLN